jgi:hypothetical protein
VGSLLGVVVGGVIRRLTRDGHPLDARRWSVSATLVRTSPRGAAFGVATDVGPLDSHKVALHHDCLRCGERSLFVTASSMK